MLSRQALHELINLRLELGRLLFAPVSQNTDCLFLVPERASRNAGFFRNPPRDGPIIMSSDGVSVQLLGFAYVRNARKASRCDKRKWKMHEINSKPEFRKT
jgi:hypothetical protein